MVPDPSQCAMFEKKSLFYLTLEEKFSVMVYYLFKGIISLGLITSAHENGTLHSLQDCLFPYVV